MEIEAASAPDGVRIVYRLRIHGIDRVIACSAAHKIGALLAQDVVGAVLTIELVVSGLAVQALF